MREEVPAGHAGSRTQRFGTRYSRAPGWRPGGDSRILARMRVTMEPIEQHRDARGSVFEPLSPEALRGQRNAHVVLTAPGHVRGNHYHVRGTETLVVRGPALVRWREAGEARDVEVAAGEVVAFGFPAGVPHAILNTGAAEGLIVGFRDVEHDPTGADTVREVLIEPAA